MFDSVQNMPLKFTGKKIPTNNAAWLNDDSMGAANFCSSPWHPISYQSF